MRKWLHSQLKTIYLNKAICVGTMSLQIHWYCSFQTINRNTCSRQKCKNNEQKAKSILTSSFSPSFPFLLHHRLLHHYCLYLQVHPWLLSMKNRKESIQPFNVPRNAKFQNSSQQLSFSLDTNLQEHVKNNTLQLESFEDRNFCYVASSSVVRKTTYLLKRGAIYES